MIRRIELAGGPHGLEVALAAGAEGGRRGAGPSGRDALFAALLPHRTVVRLGGGRPTLRGSEDLHLSLSHAAGVTVLAVAPFPVGIDIEDLDPSLDALAIDPELFGARDFALLEAQAEPARREQFYRLWTLKEASLKRRGRTLADAELPEIAGNESAGMSTAWLDLGARRYCVGVSWDAEVAASAALASRGSPSRCCSGSRPRRF